MLRFSLYAILLCACGRGGSDLCVLSTKCPADSQQPIQSTLTGQNITDCKHNLKGPCASKYESWASCGWDNQTCKADGTTDWDALNAACTDKFNEYFACCAGADGGC